MVQATHTKKKKAAWVGTGQSDGLRIPANCRINPAIMLFVHACASNVAQEEAGKNGRPRVHSRPSFPTGTSSLVEVAMLVSSSIFRITINAVLY